MFGKHKKPDPSEIVNQPYQYELSTQEVAHRAWISFLIVVGGLLLLGFMYSIRSIIFQLVIALIVALALAPMVRLFMRRGLNRTLASTAAVTLTLVGLLVIIGAIAAPLVTQGDDLVRNAPKLAKQVTSNPAFSQLNQQYQLDQKVQELTQRAPSLLAGAGTPILGVLGSVVGAISTTAVILIIALFMLIEGPSSWQRFLLLLEPTQGAWLENVGKRISVAVSGFITGNLFISLIAGIVTLVTLLIFGVPYAFALAALVAVFDLIPLVGATIATVAVALVALTQGWVIALIVTGILLAYQFIEGNIIQPIVYARAVELSQLLIIVASIIGAALGGILGVLLAIPIAAAVQIIVVELLRNTSAGQRAHIADAAPAEPAK
ncbi:hypothetical protein CYG49_02465 [Candidatus Saccharibacteria bacterium]|nr:MAG: hypothetical protein CYG49_02465 [Candidatus Saccharibacteria bacterium]